MGHCLFLRKGEVHTAPVTGVLASSLAVGSTVKLMEGGTAVEYLVVNQGIPSNSSLYDASCNGTWLLRKDLLNRSLYKPTAYFDTNISYDQSNVYTYLSNDFFNGLGETEQATIKKVKIPYAVKSGSNWIIANGAGGLSVRVFILSATEMSFVNISEVRNEGASLNYFDGLTNADDKKRIAYLNGTANMYFLRSGAVTYSYDGAVLGVTSSGSTTIASGNTQMAVRPALVLPSNALFDETTMLLKGVK